MEQQQLQEQELDFFAQFALSSTDSEEQPALTWAERDEREWTLRNCVAFYGFCVRAGAFWNVRNGALWPGYEHVASWYGRSPCKCQRKADHRAIWDGSYDGPGREICSTTAVHETGQVIRVISTDASGVRAMSRQVVAGSDPALTVGRINRSRMSSGSTRLPYDTTS